MSRFTKAPEQDQAARLGRRMLRLAEELAKPFLTSAHEEERAQHVAQAGMGTLILGFQGADMDDGQVAAGLGIAVGIFLAQQDEAVRVGWSAQFQQGMETGFAECLAAMRKRSLS
jgi:hypothetical protein